MHVCCDVVEVAEFMENNAAKVQFARYRPIASQSALRVTFGRNKPLVRLEILLYSYTDID